MAERFAIYHAPAATGPLWERAATWLGRDAASGALVEGPVAGIDRDRLLNLTQSANRYGFHATIKAPMALAEGQTEAGLREALAYFCAVQEPVSLGRLQLVSIEGFLALVPDPQSEELTDFAAHVVETFEPFRAEMTIRDRAARLAKGLTPRQEELLDGYGYPYVFEQFQLHMTLTDRLAEADRADIMAAARTWFEPVIEGEYLLDSLSLFVEPERNKPFLRTFDAALGSAG